MGGYNMLNPGIMPLFFVFSFLALALLPWSGKQAGVQRKQVRMRGGTMFLENQRDKAKRSDPCRIKH
jgi:hypothetical protein